MSNLKASQVEFVGTSGSTGNNFRYNDTTKRYEMLSNGFWIVQAGTGIIIPGKTKVAFSYTGSAQAWTVPSGVTAIYAKVWGAGGGGGRLSGWNYGMDGGGGGHSRGIIPVTAGSTLYIIVGGPGTPTAGGYAGGGAPSASGSYCAGGGGYSGIFVTAASNGNEMIVAGGGGGGGASRSFNFCSAGAGGGLEGQDGQAFQSVTYRGRGGTQSAGGASAAGSSGAGTKFQGGIGSPYGGGGGGGYYGGSGGAYLEPDTMGGGGGGSGWVGFSGTVLGETFRGSGRYPACWEDPDFPSTLDGTGNVMNCHGGMVTVTGGGNTGGVGHVVIYY